MTLIGLILLAFNLRTAVTSVPPLLDRISADLGFSAIAIGVLGALPALAFAASGLLTVGLLRRFSAERLAVALLLFQALGLIIRPWSGSALGFLLITAVTLLGMGIGNVILPVLVKAWFPDRIGLATAAYVTALTVGTSAPALVAVPIATSLDWQRSLALWGVLALLPVPLWLVIARSARVLPTGRASGGESASEQRVERVLVYRSPIAWGLALVFAMNALNLYAMFTWLPVRLIDAGASEAHAGAMLALYAGVGVLPALAIPPLLGRFGRAGLITIACVGLFIGGYLGLLFTPNEATWLWVVLAGLGGSGFPLVLTLFGLRSGSVEVTGAVAGFAQGFGYLVAASGPLTVGLLYDVTGGWTAPFGFLGLTLLVMLFGGWLGATDKTVDDDLRHRQEARAVSPVTIP